MVKFEVDIDQSELQSEIKRKTAAIKDTLIGLKRANADKRRDLQNGFESESWILHYFLLMFAEC